VAADASGVPRVLFSHTDSSGYAWLTLARWNGSGWDMNTPRNLGDRVGNVALALYGPDRLNAALSSQQNPSPDWSAWTLELDYIDGNGNGSGTGNLADYETEECSAMALALDSQGYPNLSHVHYGAFTGLGTLVHSSWNGTRWESFNIAPQGATAHLAVAVDPAGSARIAFVGQGQALRLAERAAGGWMQTTAVPAGSYPSLGIDGQGASHLGFYDSGAVKHARSGAPAWEVETVEEGVGETISEEAKATALALDGEGKPVIAYVDPAHGAIKVAFRASSGWTVVVVYAPDAAPSLVVYGLSLFIDSRGDTHLSVWDSSVSGMYELRYARVGICPL
jgi:hypothetical protein